MKYIYLKYNNKFQEDSCRHNETGSIWSEYPEILALIKDTPEHRAQLENSCRVYNKRLGYDKVTIHEMDI